MEYKIYVNPLLDRLNKTGLGAKVRDIICNTNACADDVTINTYSDQDAQILIDIAADFTNLERYELQPSKTNIFRIKPSYRLSISGEMQTLLLNDSDTVQQATQVLSLPQNTPDCTVYLLTGFLPIELQLHKKALVFFNICSQNEESIEKQLARRQLAVKSNNSNSWFVVIKKLLLKYNLNDPIYLLDHPVE